MRLVQMICVYERHPRARHERVEVFFSRDGYFQQGDRDACSANVPIAEAVEKLIAEDEVEAVR
jgi:hypothetical protein